MSTDVPGVRAGDLTKAQEDKHADGYSTVWDGDDEITARNAAMEEQLVSAFTQQGIVDDNSDTEENDDGDPATLQLPDEIFTPQESGKLQITLYRKECMGCGELFPVLGEKYFALNPSCRSKPGCPAGYISIVVQSKKKLLLTKLLNKMQEASAPEERLELLTEAVRALQGEEPHFVKEAMAKLRELL